MHNKIHILTLNLITTVVFSGGALVVGVTAARCHGDESGHRPGQTRASAVPQNIHPKVHQCQVGQ